MKKVLVIAPAYSPANIYGGPIPAVHEFNKALIRNGLDVTVYTTNANGAVNLAVDCGREILIDGVKVFYFSRCWKNKFFFSIDLIGALIKNVKKFDFIHIHWLYVFTTLIGSRVARRVGVPYVISPHGMLDENALRLKSTWKKKLYIWMFEKTTIECAACVHYSSLGERESSLIKGEFLTTKTKIVPNVVRAAIACGNVSDQFLIEQFAPHALQKRVILCVGRLNYVKGLNLIVDALPLIIEKHPDCHLILVGPDSDGYKAGLVDQIRALDMTGHVTFTGLLERDEIDFLLQHASVFVSSSYLESFGMAVAEAMASSLPVCVTDRVNIAPEILSAGAGLVSECSASGLACNVCRILEDAGLGGEMGRRGRAFVLEHYSEGAVGKALANLVESIGQANPRTGKLSKER